MGLLTDNNAWIRERMANAQLSDKLFSDHWLFATHFASALRRVVQTKSSPNQCFLSTSLTLKSIVGCGCENDC
jgi:hypothetical protein